MGAPKQSSAPQLFLPSFTSSVLRSLVFSCQDQSILVSGYHTRGNQVLSYQLLSALMEQVEQHPLNLAPSVLLASELLDFLCCSKDECGGAVVVVTVTIRPEVLTLTSAHFSCLLLNTSQLCMYKVCCIEIPVICICVRMCIYIYYTDIP